MVRQKPLKLIRASAGSGKTFSLTAHYLILLFSGVGKYREILAVTFTNKATAEMKERILSSLEELASSGYTRSKFSGILQQNYPDLSDQDVRLRASEIYSSILHDYSRFSVNTIDGFVQQLIRSFAFELNLDSGYKLEMNQDKVKDELIKALNLHLEKDPDLLEWVTNLAIDRINDGKDWDYQKTLGDLADEIFKERYYPFQEAMLAMGDEQGKEFNSLRQIVSTGISEFKADLSNRTQNIKKAFDDSGVLVDELNQKSRHPLFKLDKIINEDIGLIKALDKLVDDFQQWPNSKLTDTSAVQSLYDRLNPEIKELKTRYSEGGEKYETYLAISKNSSYLRLMQGMADLLKNYRSENRALLISDAQHLLKGITGSDVDNPSFIWEKTGNKFKHFLFDEFQDTSTFQWMNFLPLIKNAIAESQGDKPEHLVVGDVKQSIYRWRNGDWRILHNNVRSDLLSANVDEENLEYNRRSSAIIIQFNNFLYSQLPKILQQQINQVFAENARDHLHEMWNLENNQLIEKAYEGSYQKSTENTRPGGRVEIKFFSKDEDPDLEEDHSAAAAYTIDKLAELLETGIAMKDIGILVRVNREAEEILECIFNKKNQDRLSRAAGKTFQVISGEALKIVNNPAVQLLISTFRILATHDQDSGIYKAECARLWQQIKNPGSDFIALEGIDWIELTMKPVAELEDILPARLCKEFHSFRQLPVNELTEKLIRIYMLGDISNHIPFLLAFRDQVAVFSSAGDQGTAAFLDWWDTEGSVKALPAAANQDAVQVMTVHKSKGLEFRAVIVPFVNWKLNIYSGGFIRKLLWVDSNAAGFDKFNLLPVEYSKNLSNTVFAQGHFEEMLLNYMDIINTLYVATTRAKDYLCLICPTLPPRPKTGVPNDIQIILSEMLSSPAGQKLEFNNDDNCFILGSGTTLYEDASVAETESLIVSSYQVNERLTEKFRRNNQKQESWYNAKQRKGVVLHGLLETISNLETLDKLINEKVQEGLIRLSEKEEIKKTVLEVLMHEQISFWFNTAKFVISEKDMILENGVVKRPDKLFVFDDHAVLLDFKFGEEQAKYIEEIKSYRNSLLQMGEFREVHAYLWYARDGKLQKV
ncbi:UvrD-helicase domain-containing protein [Daejeonella sp. JGW-45]|uniref:UvrD-helicase domain-containing protein n=1 Tax=Daejeonella sp. JGW-45 TaxID=3034148 RepID=UPI0023EC005B|nr:UvrD-helicase domain-containing protein [Daejeonella sp. JGW-45]